MIQISKRFKFILLGIACLLLIPLVAMQFTAEVDWGIFDFIVATFLLLSAGLVLDYVLRKIKPKNKKIAAIVTMFVILIAIWMEMAVGIFDSPIAGS